MTESEPRPDGHRTNILVIPLPDARPRPTVREAPAIPRPVAPAPDVREPRPAPAVRPTRPVAPVRPEPIPSAPAVATYPDASGYGYEEPTIRWRDTTRTPTPSRTRPVRAASPRRTLVVAGTAAGSVGAAGYLAGLLSSTAPFVILVWLGIGAGFLIVVVKAARAVGALIPGARGK